MYMPLILLFAADMVSEAQQPLLRGVDGELSSIDSDPSSPYFLGDCRRGAGPRKSIQDDVSWLGGSCNDPLQQGFVLLRRVASFFAGKAHDLN